MTEYPIAVKRFDNNTALAIICETCGAGAQADPDNLISDDMYPCPRGCNGYAVHKYSEADHECPNCGTLGWFDRPLAPCCSRACALQYEYARQIGKA
jgi:rubrerythrin